MTKDSEILQKALVACSESEQGLYRLLTTQPITVICDKLAQRLYIMGYRVIKHSETQNRSKK